ncbi:hypothetical protein ZIOFF_016100 [Zingiber officinale]|uniref:Uncharacterized protein n=1 Tax=Zingiber officinale TaxID=94328 RepID=A0A8J5LGC4_ZINOF|nr:hypothetical protein ZIOFF_016100 [Zingiber officinale]
MFSGSFLNANDQSDAIAEVGQIYSRGLLPQLIAFTLYYPMQRFLKAQNIINPMAIIVVVVLLFHILISWLAVFVLDFGLLGASITLSISWWVLVLSTCLYIILSPSCRATWTDLSVKAFTGICLFFKLTVSSTIMLVLPPKSGDLTQCHIYLCELVELGLHDHARPEQCRKELLQVFMRVDDAGVAIGSGWQAIVAYVNVGAYYLIGLPIGIVFRFKKNTKQLFMMLLWLREYGGD